MRKYIAVLLSVILSFAFIGCTKGGSPQTDQAITDNTEYRIKTNDLIDTGEFQERWMSIAGSRLVVNPFDFNQATTVSQVQHSNLNTVPLNIGYLDPYGVKKLGKDTTMGNVLMVLEDLETEREVASEPIVTTWQPDVLTYSAKYAGGAEASGYDYFYDEKTVIRSVNVDKGKISVAGLYKGSASFSGNTLLIENTLYRMAITASAGLKFQFYANGGEMYLKGRDLPAPRADGVWALDIPQGKQTVYFSVAIDTLAAGANQVAALSKAPFEKNNILRRKSERTQKWNQVLNKIPYTSFTDMPLLENSGALAGVTDEETALDYYTAWALIYSGILPPNPELEYPYYQVACGKPSMWDEGERRASYSASWESFFGIQMLSFIEPEIAWSAYKGMMSLVSEDGILGGESLPPENAHTAWICYENQRELQHLKDIYPALKRHLQWRKDNPRWILNDHDYPNEKDYDFASILLLDIEFAKKIAVEIGKSDEIAFWDNLSDEMYEEIKEYFYTADRLDPYQYYNPDNVTLGKPVRSSGARTWVVKSLMSDKLDGTYLTRTLDYAKKGYNVNKSFIGFSAIKYDNYAYTAMGLIKNNELERGTKLLESGMRDVVRAKFIGENYNPGANGLVAANDVSCSGVRPSLFGAAIILESILQTNGFARYEGGISAINLYDRVSTVSNLTINGKTYFLTMDGNASKVTIACGDKIKHYPAPRGQYVKIDLKDFD